MEAGFKAVPFKKGRRIIGELRTYPDGTLIYFARRKQSEINKDGRLTISDAIRDGVAGWSFDDETMFRVRSKVIPFVGVLVSDTGDTYLTRAEAFFAMGEAKRWRMQADRKNGAVLRTLPLHCFSVKQGQVQIKRGA